MIQCMWRRWRLSTTTRCHFEEQKCKKDFCVKFMQLYPAEEIVWRCVVSLPANIHIFLLLHPISFSFSPSCTSVKVRLSSPSSSLVACSNSAVVLDLVHWSLYAMHGRGHCVASSPLCTWCHLFSYLKFDFLPPSVSNWFGFLVAQCVVSIPMERFLFFLFFLAQWCGRCNRATVWLLSISNVSKHSHNVSMHLIFNLSAHKCGICSVICLLDAYKWGKT